MTNEEFQKFIIENMVTKADMEDIRQSLLRIESKLEKISLKVNSHDATLRRAK